MLQDMVDGVAPVRQPVGRPRKRPAKLHGDKGYDYHACRQALVRRGIKARIARKGIESATRLGHYRYVIERCLEWTSRFRRLVRRYDRKASHFLGFPRLACAVICYRRAIKLNLLLPTTPSETRSYAYPAPDQARCMLTALRQHLPGVGVQGVAAGLHLLITLPTGRREVDVSELAERLRHAGVLVHPLSWHRQRPGPPGFVLGYAAHPPDRLEEAARRIGRRPADGVSGRLWVRWCPDRLGRLSRQGRIPWRFEVAGLRPSVRWCMMIAMSKVHGLTIAIQVGNTVEALRLYSAVLGRGPDYVAHDDFHEWEVCKGAWLQVSSGHENPGLTSSRLRFEVADIAAEIEQLRGLGVEVAEPTTLPDVVVFTDFTDPWGNRLGLYQDIAGPDGPPEVGGSASDESLFRSGIVTGDG
jgi:predicted enzyme related to lactoylglutathione lyase